jgi:hypothetical protein
VSAGDADTSMPTLTLAAAEQGEPELTPAPEEAPAPDDESALEAVEGSPEIADEASVVDRGEGITIEVPAGRRSDVIASVVAGLLDSGEVAYDLQPSGAIFDTPLVLTIPDTVALGRLIGVGAALVDEGGEVELLSSRSTNK